MYSLLLAIFAVIMLVMTEKLKNGTVAFSADRSKA